VKQFTNFTKVCSKNMFIYTFTYINLKIFKVTILIFRYITLKFIFQSWTIQSSDLKFSPFLSWILSKLSLFLSWVFFEVEQRWARATFFWVRNRNSATWRKPFRNRNSATFYEMLLRNRNSAIPQSQFLVKPATSSPQLDCFTSAIFCIFLAVE
jgi:hypothetical protein